MSAPARHPVLLRQLRRLGIDPLRGGRPPTAAQWEALLARVELTYTEHDRSREVLERSLELSSREMIGRLDEQRRRDEVRLLVRRRRVASIFDAVPTPLFALDGRDRVVAANPAAVGAFGALPTLVGRHIDDVLDAGAGHADAPAPTVIVLPEDDDPLASIVVVPLVARVGELDATRRQLRSVS